MADGATTTTPRHCRWCWAVELTDPRAIYCSRRCRQASFRLRRRSTADGIGDTSPAVFCYADPPYPGLSSKYYRDEPTFAGEVDHRALIASLEASGYAGWALSTSARALRYVLPLCPPSARVCAWVKPIGVPDRTRGIHNAWEPLIVVGGRQRPPGVRDHLRAMPARFGGELMGRKPLAFCAWLFDLLGMQPGDELVDLFPGTGIVGRAWADLSRGSPRDVSVGALRDGPSPRGVGDASGAALGDVSRAAAGDGSSRAADDGASAKASGDVSTGAPRRRFLAAVVEPLDFGGGR